MRTVVQVYMYNTIFTKHTKNDFHILNEIFQYGRKHKRFERV